MGSTTPRTEISDEPAEAATDGVHIDLWTRRPVCGARTEVIDRLTGLDAADAIAGFTVETLPDEVALGEHTEHTGVRAAYRDFSAWADANDVSISPPFESRRVTSLVGRSTEVLRVPVLCLAVSEDGTLTGVYPCSDGERTWSVSDYLTAFERAGGPPATAGGRPLPSAE